MTAIYKRELSSYFNSMIGYVFVAVLIFFTGIYFMAYNLYNGLPQVSYTLYSLMSILLITIPILTMKSMAEERHSRTDQLLLTSPVTLTGVVLGKYFAMVTLRISGHRHVPLLSHREPDHLRGEHLCRAAHPVPVGRSHRVSALCPG